MKHKIIAILVVLCIVVLADLLTLGTRVTNYFQESLNYPDTIQVYVKYSDDVFHIYESPDVDGFKVVKFEELPKPLYFKVKMIDFMVKQSTNVIIV